MLNIEPGTIPTRDLHQFLLGCVSPRPIAFVSTIDENGTPNLAPYSFFNAFSSNPPIVVFSSNRRVLNNTTKDTLHNIKESGEAVINMVSYNIVRQMAVASVEFPTGISEFEKTGLTPIPADLVKPPRVKESPAHLECKVQDIISLGEHGGAGHLIICKVVKMHVSEEVMDGNNRIDPHKIDLMGRMGRSYYVRASGDAVQAIVQPVTKICIGYDQLPEGIRQSSILSANNIGQLAGSFSIPTVEEVKSFSEEDDKVQDILREKNPKEGLYRHAKELLDAKDAREMAMKILMFAESLDS